jgi:hypothetical protein
MSNADSSTTPDDDTDTDDDDNDDDEEGVFEVGGVNLAHWLVDEALNAFDATRTVSHLDLALFDDEEEEGEVEVGTDQHIDRGTFVASM